MLGTNGGGFFNANAAHPFENPTALSNFVQIVSIFALGAALTNVFGRMVGDERQGWAILAAMGVLFLAGTAVVYWAESAGSPVLNGLGLTGGNMEGKEVRFGIVASALFAADHHGSLLRRGQRHARQLHRARRHDPADQHGARRDHRRRRRGGALRHPRLRHRDDLRRRPHGRAHAGIPRQEDRGQGGQDGDARHPVPAADDAGVHGAGHRGRGRPRGPGQCRPARLLGDPLRLHLGGRQQRLGLRRAHRQHPVLQHHARPSACCSGGSS